MSSGTVYELRSAILQETRRWSLKLPNGKHDGPVNLLYVLDGQKLFGTACSMSTFLSRLKIASLAPAAVIAIDSNENRTDNFTPTRSSARRDGTIPAGKFAVGGKAELFRKFLAEELLPQAESHLPSGTRVGRRILIGHSFAGLFVLETLRTAPAMFDDYVALDPSLWWDRAHWSQAFCKNGVTPGKVTDKRLYVAIAGVERNVNRLHMTQARNLADMGKTTLERQGVEVTVKNFPEEIHGTIPIPGLFDALKTLFVKMPSD